jgi:sec-independent protein translocase protein TatA
MVGYEWLIAVGVLIVIFLWGPQKLPELAKSIGQAKQEFDRASKESSTTIEKPVTSTISGSPQGSPGAPDPIIIAAKSLGINTEGLTKEEIGQRILGLSTKSA